MTQLLTEADMMARKRTEQADMPLGPLILWNLLRYGFADVVPKSALIADRVSAKSGKPMSKQRVSAIMNAVRVEADTIEQLAKGLGLKAADLLDRSAIEP